jgi:hypothetical protein
MQLSVCHQSLSNLTPRFVVVGALIPRLRKIIEAKRKEKMMKAAFKGAIGGGLLIAVIGLPIVTAESNEGPVFIAGDKPVTEDQVRQKLQSDGWSDVQILHGGRYFQVVGSKNGEDSKIIVDSETGRLLVDIDEDE